MARPNNSTLLLPFMAVVALIFPFALGPRQSAFSVGSATHHVATSSPHTVDPIPTVGDADKETSKDEDKDKNLHNAQAILTGFFGQTPIDHNDLAESPVRGGYRLDLMIFTVPDPVDSRLSYLFDRNLTSMQRAAEANSYVLDRFDLPWLEEIRARDSGSNSKSAGAIGPVHGHHEYESQPGYLLFSRPNPDNPEDNASALLVFVVGETPTAGIHKTAMISALDEISWLCGYTPSASRPPAVASEVSARPHENIPMPGDCQFIDILGPSFSGSAQSLDFVLHSWRQSRPSPSHPRFRIVSGSATAVPVCSKIFRFGPKDPNVTEDPPVFSATVVRDSTALNFMLQFLNDAHRDTSEPPRVALLTEGNTTYGASIRLASKDRPEKKKDQKKERESATPHTLASQQEQEKGLPGQTECKEPELSTVKPVVLPFPLHISGLRSESERARKQRESSQQNPQELTSSFSLPLPTEDDAGDAKDSVPPVSQLDISASELMLSNLLSTISREQFQYVGIAATDVRDVIFLAREIREHSPATVIFSLNADLLYSHPEAYPQTRGMLVATPYPLFALNQSWMNPVTGDDGVRIQFPDQSSEGIYNAALYLMQGDHPLLEYASPFTRLKLLRRSGDQYAIEHQSVPALWIVTVGRDGFWPVAVRALDIQDPSWPSYTLSSPPPVPASKPAGPNHLQSELVRSVYALLERTLWPNAPLDSAAQVDARKRSNRGIVPQLTHAVLILWGFLCVVPTMMFLSKLSERPASWRLLTRFSKWIVSSFQLHRLFCLATIDAKCFFLIGGTASLSVYAIAITAYSISAIAPANLLRWFFLLLMISVMALGLAACAQLATDIVVDIIKHMKREDAECASGIEHFNSRWFAVPILAGVALTWLFTLFLISNWLCLGSKHPGEGVITGFRAVNLQNGVSPLPPFFCIGLAAFLWVFCSLRRLCFLREVFPSDDALAIPNDVVLPEPPADPCAALFFFSDSRPFRGLLALEIKLRTVLECPTLLASADSRVAMGVIVAMALFWGGYLFFTRLVFAFEVRPFYYLLGVTFLLVVVGILSNVLRVYLLWNEVLAILRRLGRLPMREAFTRFREQNATLPRMTLTTSPEPLTTMGVSILAASDLFNTAQNSRRVLGNGREIDRAFDHGNDLIGRAKVHHEHALNCLAEGKREDCNTSQRAAQWYLNQFTRDVEAILALSWNTLLANGVRRERVEKARKQLEEQAEEFLVSRAVHFLAHMFPQLTNLASYSMGCLFLMMMAISSYPLQPRNPFSYFCWFIIFAFVAVVLLMAVQMNRDAVLSCLNGTKPGEIDWDAGFISRIIFLIVVPLLGLVGVQFPDTISQILRWVTPGGSGHP